MESILQQSQVRLGAHRHLGGHLASFQSGNYCGYHQSSGYATLDECPRHRTHDLGYQDHDLRSRWRRQEEMKPNQIRGRLGVRTKYRSGSHHIKFQFEVFCGGSNPCVL